MSTIQSALAEDFSLTRGSPFHRMQLRFGLAGKERQRVVGRALLTILLTWAPLLVLSLVQGRAYGKQIRIPFLRDLAVNVRFLIAAPILILAESGIDQRWRTLVLQSLSAGLAGENELPAFELLIEKITRLRDRILLETFMLIAAFFPSIVKTELLMGGVPNWHTAGTESGAVSLAGWWFNLVRTHFSVSYY